MLNRYQIHARLKERGHTYTSVAAEIGVSRSSVSDVVTGRQTSRRIAEYICVIIDTKLNDAFGTKYAISTPRNYRTSTSFLQAPNGENHAK